MAVENISGVVLDLKSRNLIKSPGSRHPSAAPIPAESDIHVTFAKWRPFGRSFSKLGMCFGNYNGQQEIAHWFRILKNDTLRLQRFEKDDFALMIGAIHGEGHETPMSAEPYQ